MEKCIENATEKVLDFLREIPMSVSTVRYYGSCYRTIGRYCKRYGIRGFSEQDAIDFSKYQIKRHEEGEIGLVYALTLRKAAAMLADSMNGKELVWKRRNYRQRQLCECYESTLIEFEEWIASTLAPGSVQVIMQMARQFLGYLEDVDVRDFSRLKLEEIRGFIIESSPRHKNNMANLTWPIKKLLSFLDNSGIAKINANSILANSPKRIKVLPCFTTAEADAILGALDTSTPLGKRDYAILMIAHGTGLRGEDILSLKLEDIDWKKNEINVVQSKTSGYIVLPLLPDVGNAIADYILNARPQADSNFIFLRHRKPHTWLGNGPAGAQIMKRYQGNMGLAHEPGDGKTFHAFRRTIGTNLIKAEIPLSSAAQILGHKSIESTKRYISLNDDALRVCCMDISDFATAKEELA